MTYYIEGFYYNGDSYFEAFTSLLEAANKIVELCSEDTNYSWQNADELDPCEVVNSDTLMLKKE